MYDAACLCADWKATLKDFRSGQSVDINEIQSYIAKGEDIDTRFERWMETLTEEFNYEKFPLTLTPHWSWLNSLLTAPGAPKVGHRYSNLSVAARWTGWRTTRLILNGNMLEMCRTMSDAPPHGLDMEMSINIHRRTKIVSRMLSLANSICEAAVSLFTIAIPAHPEADTSIDIPAMRGYSILWPLFIAGKFYKWASLHQLSVNHRREWVKATLLFIQDQLSIQKAGAFNRALEGWHVQNNHTKEHGYPPEVKVPDEEAILNIIPDLPASPYPESEFFELRFTSNPIPIR